MSCKSRPNRHKRPRNQIYQIAQYVFFLRAFGASGHAQALTFSSWHPCPPQAIAPWHFPYPSCMQLDVLSSYHDNYGQPQPSMNPGDSSWSESSLSLAFALSHENLMFPRLEPRSPRRVCSPSRRLPRRTPRLSIVTQLNRRPEDTNHISRPTSSTGNISSGICADDEGSQLPSPVATERRPQSTRPYPPARYPTSPHAKECHLTESSELSCYWS
jgi:hypothetical protein